VAQAVSRLHLTAEAWVRSRFSPCGICGGQSGTGTGFPPRTSGFPCQFHFTGAPLHVKTKKLITFLTRLHNKPQGCGASVSACWGGGGLHHKKEKKLSYFLDPYAVIMLFICLNSSCFIFHLKALRRGGGR
jgi:hypothetical protein